MELVVVGITLKVVDDLLPISGEDVPVCSMETLVDICPCTGVEFWDWGIALSG